MRDRIHAIGWTGLNNAFGAKSEYIDLLPFPQLVKDETVKDESLSSATINSIKRLKAIDKLPKNVLSAIAQSSPAIAKHLDEEIKNGLY